MYRLTIIYTYVIQSYDAGVIIAMTIVHVNYKMWSSALLLQALLLCTLAKDIRYVKPDNSSAENCPGKPCLTLSEFSANSHRYVTTGSIFTFMNGNHSLHTIMRFISVSDITLRGVEDNFVGRILLTNNGSLVCNNVSNFHIEGLTFILCKYEPLLQLDGSLNFLNSNRVIMINSTIQGNCIDCCEIRKIKHHSFELPI